MRVKEWYGWHFPELKELVKDNALYARVVRAVQSRAFFHDDDCVAKLLPIVLDEALAREIRDAGRASMGQELSATDLQSVNLFAAKLASFFYGIERAEWWNWRSIARISSRICRNACTRWRRTCRR